MRRLITTLAVAALAIGFAGVSEAKAPQCKDASGKFIKCPEAAATPAPTARCRDKTTKKFAKCSAPNTEPVPTAGTPAAASSSSPKPASTPAAASSPSPKPSMSTAASPKPTGTGTPKPH